MKKTNFHTVVSFFQPKCIVYACFVANMSKMAFTCFGGQFQFEKSMLGRLDNSGAGVKAKHKTLLLVAPLARIRNYTWEFALVGRFAVVPGKLTIFPIAGKSWKVIRVGRQNKY